MFQCLRSSVHPQQCEFNFKHCLTLTRHGKCPLRHIRDKLWIKQEFESDNVIITTVLSVSRTTVKTYPCSQHDTGNSKMCRASILRRSTPPLWKHSAHEITKVLWPRGQNSFAQALESHAVYDLFASIKHHRGQCLKLWPKEITKKMKQVPMWNASKRIYAHLCTALNHHPVAGNSGLKTRTAHFHRCVMVAVIVLKHLYCCLSKKYQQYHKEFARPKYNLETWIHWTPTSMIMKIKKCEDGSVIWQSTIGVFTLHACFL